METLSEDGNINISNVTNVVANRVGNLFGKGIGGLSSKLGGGGWFQIRIIIIKKLWICTYMQRIIQEQQQQINIVILYK